MPSHAAGPSSAKEATKRSEISIHSSSLTSTSPRDRFPPDQGGDQEEERSNEMNGKKHQTSYRKENIKSASSLRPSRSSYAAILLDPRFSGHIAYSRPRDAREGETPSGLVFDCGRTEMTLEDRRGGTPRWRKRHGRGLVGQSGRMELERRSPVRKQHRRDREITMKRDGERDSWYRRWCWYLPTHRYQRS